jgi:hypothetical protein
MSNEKQNKPAPALGPAVMRAIGRKVRVMYADIIAEGVPERFAAILRRLDEPRAAPKVVRQGVRTLNLKPGDGDT